MKLEPPKKTLAEMKEEIPAAYKVIETLMYKVLKVVGKSHSNLGAEEILEAAERLFNKGFFKVGSKEESDGGIFYLLIYLQGIYVPAYDSQGKIVSIKITEEAAKRMWNEDLP